MQRRTFLQGMIAAAVAMPVLLRSRQTEPTVALGRVPPGSDYGWFEHGIKDGVAYQAMGIGDTVYVLYVTADGQSHSKLITNGDVGLGDAMPNHLLHIT